MTARRSPAVRGHSLLLRRLPVRRLVAVLLVVLAAVPAACSGAGSSSPRDDRVLTIGAIPDQDPDKLARLYGTVAGHLGTRLGVRVEFRPVTDYTAAVSLFRTGDLQLVWFGGLTGVQARQQTPGAVPLVQRDIDSSFHSLFLGHVGSGLAPVDDVAGLAELRGRRFTFGSRSSTSGFLMPASFLLDAGVDPARDLAGRPGYSGSHDTTIDLVSSGSYEAGAVNEQVWRSRLARGTVDTDRVQVLFRSPAFADYHWLAGPSIDQEFGAGTTARVRQALLDLRPDRAPDATVLELFGARSFVPTSPAAYTQIEATARRLDLLGGS